MNSEDRNKLKQEHDRALLESVDYLAVKELNVANKLYAPRFHSQHEGYALLLEEVEEASAAIGQLKVLVQDIMWPGYVRKNKDVSSSIIKDLEGEAIHAAQECIQVIAMAKKWRASFLAVPAPTEPEQGDILTELHPHLKKLMKDLLASNLD